MSSLRADVLIVEPVVVFDRGEPVARWAGFLPTGGGDFPLLLLASCCESCDTCDACEATEAERGVVGRGGSVCVLSRWTPDGAVDPDVLGLEFAVCRRGGGGGGGVADLPMSD